MNDGSALVARGEPLIWLTCGALVFVVAMIVGLVLLIVAQGVRTFWPQPVVRLSLQNGKTVLGEVTRSETYTLSPEQIAALRPEAAATLQEQIDRGEPARVRRRLLRTGNFELTQRHFDEIPDFEIAPGGETYPEWAMVLERVAWGRFYGEPEAYVVRHPRIVSGDEEQLERLIAFFEAHLPRLDEATRKDIAEPLDAARAQLAGMRRQSTESLIAMVKASAAPDASLNALVGTDRSARPVALSELPEGTIVSEIREVCSDPAVVWSRFLADHPGVRERFHRQTEIEKHEIGRVNRAVNDARLRVKEVELETARALEPRLEELRALHSRIDGIAHQREETRQLVRQAERRFGGTPLPAAARAISETLNAEQGAAATQQQEKLDAIEATLADAPARARAVLDDALAVSEQVEHETQRLVIEIDELRTANEASLLRMRTAGGKSVDLKLADVVRAYPANQLSLGGKLGVYFDRWAEFLTEDPREANSEGGVFPAIWGTVTMTLIMSLAVVPFGVLAALYLREYARGGWMVSIIRISVNNLAGVPSIVFGVFGLGFFCYIFGSYIDGGPVNAGFTPWPPARWFFALTVLAVLAVGAFAGGLFSLSSRKAEASRIKRWAGRLSLLLWIAATVLLIVLIAKTPFFDGFFRTSLPNPTYGKGGLIWASLTLALMTLPVVIVATEESLAAVPNSMREGSYACGASKWQTIARIVLPRALPGIMTGMILAMARGAGEVAPLMLVGAVKLAPELPVDLEPPFLHPERSFMHLGFHVFDLGFQSPNVDAARPMVFTTTLLLIVIIAVLNFSAIWLRTRLRRRYRAAQF